MLQLKSAPAIEFNMVRKLHKAK